MIDERILENAEVTKYDYFFYFLNLKSRKTEGFPSLEYLLQLLIVHGRPDLVVVLLYCGVLDSFLENQSTHEIDIEYPHRIVMDEFRRCCQIQHSLTSLIRAVKTEDCVEIGRVLRENPRSIFEEDQAGCNGLFWALISNKVDAVRQIFSHFMTVLPDKKLLG